MAGHIAQEAQVADQTDSNENVVATTTPDGARPRPGWLIVARIVRTLEPIPQRYVSERDWQ